MSYPRLTTDVSSLLHLGHAAMRDLVAALPVSALDWKPGQETNSIAAVVVHALDAERHLTGVVAGIAMPRDRAAAFRVEGLTGDELVTQIDAAERDVAGHLALVTGDRLAAAIERPRQAPEASPRRCAQPLARRPASGRDRGCVSDAGVRVEARVRSLERGGPARAAGDDRGLRPDLHRGAGRRLPGPRVGSA